MVYGQLYNRICLKIFSVSCFKYLNNTSATRKNLFKLSLSDSPSYSFCLHPETLQNVVSSCRSYLEDGRFTWRHNSVLLFNRLSTPAGKAGNVGKAGKWAFFRIWLEKLENHRFFPCFGWNSWSFLGLIIFNGIIR